MASTTTYRGYKIVHDEDEAAIYARGEVDPVDVVDTRHQAMLVIDEWMEAK